MSGRLLLGLLLAAGCGPLADAEYRGELLFTLEGTVYAEAGSLSRDADVRVALFWAHGADAREEQAVVVQTAFPARYTLELYAWPPPEVRFAGASGGEYAIGTPLLYQDLDGDQRYDPDRERLVGGSPEIVVVFAEEEAPFEPGFQRVLSQASRVMCNSTVAAESLALHPEPDVPTDLVIGEAWWESLGDWDCDEGFEEWDAVCPEGGELDRWCVSRSEDVDAACADRCPPR
jgi:hypothetical protein